MVNPKRLKKMINIAHPLVKTREAIEKKLVMKGKTHLIKGKLPEEVYKKAAETEKISEQKLKEAKAIKFVHSEVILGGSIASKTATEKSDIDHQIKGIWKIGRGPFLPFVVLKGSKAKIKKEMEQAREKNALELINDITHKDKTATIHSIKQEMIKIEGYLDTEKSLEKREKYLFLVHAPLLKTLKKLEKEGKIKAVSKTGKGTAYKVV